MAEKFSFVVDGKSVAVEAEPAMPLLYALRSELGLTNPKFGCGKAQCGACTVHVDGQPTKSCNVNAASVVGKKVTTIEGLSADASHPVQKAWIEHTVPQCGYCQSGQIMAAVALLRRSPKPTDREIDQAMADNLCRCGTYAQIREAIHAAAKLGAA